MTFSSGSPKRPADRQTRASSQSEREVIQCYGDESLGRSGYDLFGVLYGSAADVAAFRSEVDALRQFHGWHERRGEFKWVKASGRRPHPAYMDLMARTVRYLLAGTLTYRCTVHSGPLAGWPRVGGASAGPNHLQAWRELLSIITIVGRRHVLLLDRRTDLQRNALATLREQLNRTVSQRDDRQPEGWQSIEARPSPSDDLLQIVDVLLGAVGYHVSNRHRTTGASPGKVALAAHLCDRLGLEDLTGRSPRSGQAFEVRWIR